MVIYLQGIPFDTVKAGKDIAINVRKLWDFLKIYVEQYPYPETMDLLTNPGENTYEAGPYATVDNVVLSLANLPPGYIPLDTQREIVLHLGEAIQHRYSRQKEFTPLWRWWRPLP